MSLLFGEVQKSEHGRSARHAAASVQSAGRPRLELERLVWLGRSAEAAPPLMRLQAMAGNRAVTALLAEVGERRSGRVRSVQRCGATQCDCAGDDGGNAGRSVQREVAERDDQLLQLGGRGPAVAELQQTLNGLDRGPLVEDGVFGPKTLSSVQGFQGDSGLVPDGIVGPRTHAALLSAAGGAGPGARAIAQPPPGTVSGTCSYAPGEKKRSADDRGGGSILPDGTAFFIDGFTQGSSKLKRAHILFLVDMIEQFELRSANSTRRVLRIEGLSDCVDSFAKNVKLRLGRATETGKVLIANGALEDNIGPAVAGDEGAKVGGDLLTEGGRALNRAAVCRLELRQQPKPEPEEEPPESFDPSCDKLGTKWTIETITQTAVTVGLGFQLFTFIVTNLATGCKHGAEFVGPAIGFSVGLSLSLPSQPDTVTTSAVHAAELDGVGLLGFVSAAGPGLGEQIGRILMVSGPLAGQSIDVGGLQFTEPSKGGVLGAGQLIVHKPGRHPE